MVGNSNWQRRLQRRADQQQRRRTPSFGRHNHRDLYLYQQLCATDDHLSSNFYSFFGATSGTHLPGQYDDHSLPDTGGSERCIRHLVGNGQRNGRLQRCPDEQQHGCTICLRRLDDRDFYLSQQLCAIDDHLPGNLHGASCT